MNGKDYSVDASNRMRKDIKFKNIIIKNACRLRQKSNDDYLNSKRYKETKINKINRITNYKKVDDNKFLDSNDNISIDMNMNLITKKNNDNNRKNTHSKIIKNMFYNLDLDKIDQKTSAETERIKDTIIPHDSFNKFQKIKVNQHKNLKIDVDNVGNNKNIGIRNENESLRRKTFDVKLHNNDIKELINDLKVKKIVINKKSKMNWKRSNSIRKIMNSLYYSSYTIPKENIDEKEQKLKDNSNKINELINKKVWNQNSNNLLVKNINIDKKIEKDYNLNFHNINKEKKNTLRDIPKISKDLNTFSIEDNSNLETNKNNGINLKKYYTHKLTKGKMIYKKPDIKLNIKDKFELFSNKKNIKIIKINNDNERIKTTLNDSKNKKRIKLGNALTPIKNYQQIRQWNLKNKNADIPNMNYIKKNFNNNVGNISNSDSISKEKNNMSIYSINKRDKEIQKEIFITTFFDDIIELSDAIKGKTIFEILIKKINKKYLIDYKKIPFETNIIDIKDNFNYCFKYFCIILICFYFLSKEDNLYKNYFEKIHLLYVQYIYASLCFIGYQNLNSKSIKRFFHDYDFKKKISIIQCTTSIIRLLFDDKEEYVSLNNILKQLMINVHTTTVKDIIIIINQTILFCFNQTSINNNRNYFYNINSNKNHNIKHMYHKEKKYNNDEQCPSIPYIKTTMKKNFCLVLDLDETISHSMNLNFGNYFFLRPGTIEFLEEISKYYEIIIFTSSPKDYADDILDKIDKKGEFISHRLYKSHVIFEKGKSVKNLKLIGRDLNKIIFVDNMKCNAKYNLKNLYLIPSWTDDIYDDEIYKLKNKLKYIYESGKFNDDITKGLKEV